MTIIVTDSGFRPLEPESGADILEIGAETDPLDLADRVPDDRTIRIAFASFGDGRGFTIARQLRLMGFRGRLRAAGPLLADQYAMARRAGFDEVEIPAEIAQRQPEGQWLARADWRAHDYQARLRDQAPFT